MLPITAGVGMGFVVNDVGFVFDARVLLFVSLLLFIIITSIISPPFFVAAIVFVLDLVEVTIFFSY